jgi:hypothetical protein
MKAGNSNGRQGNLIACEDTVDGNHAHHDHEFDAPHPLLLHTFVTQNLLVSNNRLSLDKNVPDLRVQAADRFV